MSRAVDNILRCAVSGHDTLGETPLWCAQTQSLLWLDIDGGRVQRFHPETGRHDVFAFDAKFAGSLALTDHSSLLADSRTDFAASAICQSDVGIGSARLRARAAVHGTQRGPAVAHRYEGVVDTFV